MEETDRSLPLAALGAVLIKASLSLLDFKALRQLYRLDRHELAFSLIATIGVIWVGAVEAILVVAILALLRFVHLTSRPRVEILGTVEGLPGLHSVARHPAAKTDPGLVLFRFNAPLVFFNEPYFRHQTQAAIRRAGPELNWFLLDALPISQLDVTGYAELEYLSETLRKQGAELVLAGRSTESDEIRRAKGIGEIRVVDRHFPTMRQAIKAYRNTHPAGFVDTACA